MRTTTLILILSLGLACGDDGKEESTSSETSVTEGGATGTTTPSTSSLATSNDTTQTQGASSDSQDSGSPTTGATSSGSQTGGSTTGGAEGSTTASTASTTAGGSAPVITMVSWQHQENCQSPQEREVTITVEVEDADTPLENLAFTGGVAGCRGSIDAAVSTVVCSGASNAVGVATVTDPQNQTDELGFTIVVCEDGSAQP